MRYVAVSALLALTFIFNPIPAEAGEMNYGGFFCNLSMPCDQSSSAFPSLTQILASTNACVTKNTVFPPPDGSFFENAAGIDSSGCLTTKPDAMPATAGGRSLPHCCIVQSGSSCIMRCDQISQ